jgi:hypothetical protein
VESSAARPLLGSAAMIKTAWLTCLLPLFLLAACDSSSDETRSTAAIQADWNAHCDAFASCNTGHDAARCKDKFACMSDMLRPDMLDKSTTCELELTCDATSDDSCYSVEVQGLTASAAGAKFRSDCLAKLGTCTPQSTAYHDDLCNGAPMFKDTLITKMAACLEHACTDVESCVLDAYISTSPACAAM